jgi:hypothetical protein
MRHFISTCSFKIPACHQKYIGSALFQVGAMQTYKAGWTVKHTTYSTFLSFAMSKRAQDIMLRHGVQVSTANFLSFLRKEYL